MKAIFLFISIIYLVACNNDDNSNVDKQPSIIGSWKSTEVWSDNGSEITKTSIPEENSFSLRFESTNAVTRSDLGEDCKEGTYNHTAEVIYFEFPCGLSYEYIINELTSNTLILDTQNFETLIYKFERVD